MAGEGRHILVVDDSATMRMLLTLLLKKAPVAMFVDEAVNGADAWRKLQVKTYDLVFTDMQMPEMDGAELIISIRETLSRTLPVIIITTLGEEDDRDFGLSIGASWYITKPVSSSMIHDVLSKYLK